METLVYVLTPVLTVFWSVTVFISWNKRTALRDDSFFRFYHILAPGSYFLAGSVSGVGVTFFRFDIAVLLYLDAVIIISVLAAFLIFAALKRNVRGKFTGVLVFYNAASILGIAAAFSIKNSPLLIMRISRFFDEVSRLDLPSLSRMTLDSVSGAESLAEWINKILIALFTYVPIALLRFIYVNRQRKRLEKQVCELEARIVMIEGSLAGSRERE